MCPKPAAALCSFLQRWKKTKTTQENPLEKSQPQKGQMAQDEDLGEWARTCHHLSSVLGTVTIPGQRRNWGTCQSPSKLGAAAERGLAPHWAGCSGSCWSSSKCPEKTWRKPG